jgi:hypothetical protein
MSNASVVVSILAMLARFENGEIAAIPLVEQLDGYVSALESLSGESRRAQREISARLVQASFSDADHPSEDPALVLVELRQWLQSVPA